MGARGSTAALQDSAREEEKKLPNTTATAEPTSESITLMVKHANDDQLVTEAKVALDQQVSTLADTLSKKTGIPAKWLAIQHSGSPLDGEKIWDELKVADGATIHVTLAPPRVAAAVAALLTARCKQIGWQDSLLDQCSPLAMFKQHPYTLSAHWRLDSTLATLANVFGDRLEATVEEFIKLPVATMGERTAFTVAATTLLADIFGASAEADASRAQQVLLRASDLMQNSAKDISHEAVTMPLGEQWQQTSNITFEYLNHRLATLDLPEQHRIWTKNGEYAAVELPFL